AVCWRGDRDDFIHFLGNGLATVLAIGSAGFASWGLGMGVARAAGKGGGLSFGCSLRFLQLLLQLLVFLAQSVSLSFQSFSLSFQSFLFPFQSFSFPFPSLALLPQPLVLSA